jgi:hypothetical protein
MNKKKVQWFTRLTFQKYFKLFNSFLFFHNLLHKKSCLEICPHQFGWCNKKDLFFTELEFTELILQILYWIYEIAMYLYSRIFVLDLPTNIDLKYIFCLPGNWVISSLFYSLGKMREYLKTILIFIMDYEYQEKTKEIN